MAEYIDRDELLKELCTVSAPTPSESWIVEKCIEKVNEQPTADVVPKSEVESIITLNSQLEAKVFEERKEVERLKHILDCYALQYGTVIEQRKVIDKAKAELASEIFAEIENALALMGICFNDETILYELKKKYTEGGK